MRASPPAPELEPFEALLGERLGLSLASLRRGDHLEGALRERARARGCADLRAYWRALAQPGTAAEELRALARRLTVGETYFFREPQQIDAFTEIAIPERLAARAGEPVRVLSAGCASGEEAYTLAIALQLAGPAIDARRVRIDGIDLNPAAIQRARATRYSWWALRATPAHVRELCFTPEGQDFALRAELRPRVSFEERNLIEEDAAFWQAGAFDVIFCRNVLMYLAPEKARGVVERLARALAPGGFLFLGSSEPLHDPAPAFDVASTHGTLYYRRSDEEASWRAAVELCEAGLRAPRGRS